ncbi:DUF1540 domain-containing protein [Paenibacillus sp. 22594]|uniref:DUF1540 domain-containing protein n=1 Tax=Paenibacillus sp. 22594 TaxID=3453947 RepID=UPI003F83841F
MFNWKGSYRIGVAFCGHNEAEVITMTTAKPLVKCSVSNCNYWGEQNLCRADQIVIEIDKHSGSAFLEEYAEEMTDKGHHHDHAATSSATCCLTFKPKD